MVNSTAAPCVTPSELAQEHLYIAASVSVQLRSRYAWLSPDDAYSFSLWGLIQAAQVYTPDRGLSFSAFACRKAMYLAIDQMRRERVVQRKIPVTADPDTRRPYPRQRPLTMDVADERHDARQQTMEIKESVQAAMQYLPAKDRQLLVMYYGDGMTLRGIGRVLRISESTACLRRKALIVKLRGAAQAQGL
jgi:RNA polymerase sigma factor (sigma-70 family)